MKSSTLVLITLFSFSDRVFSNAQTCHFFSGLAAVATAAAAGTSGLMQMHHKRKLARLRAEYKHFENEPVRMVHLDHEAQLRLRKWQLATGLFAGFSLISAIAWLLTVPKKGENVPPNAFNSSPVCKRKRTESGQTSPDTFASTECPSEASRRTSFDGHFPTDEEIKGALEESGVDLDPMEATGTQEALWSHMPLSPSMVTPPAYRATRGEPRIPITRSVPPARCARQQWQRPLSPQMVTQIPVTTMQNYEFMRQLWDLRVAYPCVYLFGTLPELRKEKSPSGVHLHKTHPPILLDYFLNIKDPNNHHQIQLWEQLEKVWKEDYRNVGLSVLFWDRNSKKWRKTTISDRSFGASKITGSELLRLHSLQVSKKMTAETVPPPSQFLKRPRT